METGAGGMMEKHTHHTDSAMPDKIYDRQSGNIFFMLFAAVALVGAFSVGATNAMKGIVTSMSEVTRKTIAEERMTGGARISIQAATAIQTGDGDCDDDGMVEPLPFRDALTAPHPTGGGYLPADIGLNSKDPWGTELGYCVWDAGPTTVSDNDADCGGNTATRLEGPKTAGTDYTVVAVISAGRDKRFSTTCAGWVDTTPADGVADAPLLVKGGDDVVLEYSYDDANGLGGDDLWKVRDTKPDTATIDKNIEVTGAGQFSGAINLMKSGLILPSEGTTGNCDATTDQQLRVNFSMSPPVLEICDFAGGNDWTAVSMGGGGALDGIPTSGLVGFWRMEEGTGNIVADDSGNDNIMTLEAGSSAPEWSALGRTGGGLLFNATQDDAAYIEDDNTLDLASFTLAGWFKIDDRSASSLLQKGDQGTNMNYMLYGASDKVGCAFANSSVYYTVFGDSTPNTWTHISCTFDQGTGDMKLYLNGVLAASDTFADTPPSTNDDVWVGYSDSASDAAVNGYADNIAIYNRALNLLETRELYKGTGGNIIASAPPMSDLIGGGPGDFLTCKASTVGTLEKSSDGPNNNDLAFWRQGDALFSADSVNGVKALTVNGDGTVTAADDTGVADTTDVWGDGTYIYATDKTTGLTAYTWNGSFNQIAQVATTDDALSVYGDGRYIYVGTTTGIEAYRLSGNALEKVGTWAGGARTLWSDGSYIFATDDQSGTSILSVLSFDGSTFNLAAAANVPFYSGDTFGDGNYIYTANNNELGIISFDGTTLTQSARNLSGNVTALWGDGVNIFIGYDDGTVQVGQVSVNAVNIKATYNTGKGNPITAFYYDGVYLYVGNTLNGMDIVTGITCDANPAPSPAAVLAIDQYAGKITAGNGHACGIKSDASAWCWGLDSNGQLGNGNGSSASQPSPVRVNDLLAFKQIKSSAQAVCAIKTDGTLWCWGSDSQEQLGNGAGGDATSPAASSDTGIWQNISVGQTHTCGIKNDASAWCWGTSADGALGLGASTSATVPTQLADAGPWVSISAGDRATCGIKTDGSAWCWGRGGSALLGINSYTDLYVNYNLPKKIAEAGPWTQISVGKEATCAVKIDGSAWCWGASASSGALGISSDPLLAQLSTVPARVADTGPWLQIFANPAEARTCGIKYDGTAWCWGNNTSGPLGNNTTTTQFAPVQIADPGPWATLSLGVQFTCGIKTDGSAWCWGDDTNGELGNGTTLTVDQLIPSRVENWPNVAPWQWQDATSISAAGSSNILLQSGTGISYDGSSASGAANGLVLSSGRSVLRQASAESVLLLETTGTNTSSQMSWKAPTASPDVRSMGIDYATGSLEFGANNTTMTNWMSAITPQLEVGANGYVGVGTTGTVLYSLEVNGGLRIGNDTDACSRIKTGTLRYVGGGTPYEYCNGTAWTGF